MNVRILSLLLAVFLLLGCCACGAREGEDRETDPASGQAPDVPADLTPAELSELAMANFVRKLQAGNYVVRGTDGPVTRAVSPEQVCFEYPHDGYPTYYAYMTLNGETFATVIEDNEMGDVEFVSTAPAIDALEELLPNNWIALTAGNLFEFFYNDVEKPLEFVSNDENVKYTLCCLGGYSRYVLEIMEEVRMTLDAADPTSVHFHAEVPDEKGSMYHYDDLDLTLRFGEAAGNAHVEAWLSDPSYPMVRTAWTKADVAALDNVFMREYGAGAVPFPSFASYALFFDPKAYDAFSGFRILDAHAGEKDVEDYRKLLLDNGYSEVAERQSDGSTVTVYRKLLREQYHAYAELYPHYDNGFVLVGLPYYEDPSYEGLPAISEVLREHGFASLDDTGLFSGWTAVEESASRSESFSYFFDYDLYMPFLLSFEDAAAARAYWDDYGNRLLAAGFVESFVAGDNRAQFNTPNSSKLFRFTFLEDNTVFLEFKSERFLTAGEANRMIADHGIPDAGLNGDIGVRNQSRYRHEISGFNGLSLSVEQPFESMAAAESYLDAYVAVLDGQGYLMTDPQKFNSSRAFLFFNEERASYVAFDLAPSADGAIVKFEFFAASRDEEDLMRLALNRLPS